MRIFPLREILNMSKMDKTHVLKKEQKEHPKNLKYTNFHKDVESPAIEIRLQIKSLNLSDAHFK